MEKDILIEICILQEKIRDVLSEYLFEVNTVQTRKNIALSIENLIREFDQTVNIVDITRVDNAELGAAYFGVKVTMMQLLAYLIILQILLINTQKEKK